VAVAVILEFDGVTLEQYDEVVKSMGLTPRGPVPPGALFHWVTKTDSHQQLAMKMASTTHHT
jgi:hypothetical protein